uniref:Retrotransposon gag domain-containing protein n=1 Tax=Podarcis muralis TaxID=64176 RepID=A0A670IYC7_PODMU
MAWDSDSESEPEESQLAQESPPPGPAELGQGLDSEEPAPVPDPQEQAPGESILAPEVLEDSVSIGELLPGPSNPSASPELQRLRAERRRELVSPRRSARLKARRGGASGGQDCPCLLKDQAAKWALPLLRQDSPLLTDYVGFCNHLESVFGNPLKESQANRAIRQLRQDKSTAAAYATEFRLLAQDLSWNDSALRDQYLEGLSDEILDQLAMMDRPTTLDALIQRSLQLDDRLEDRRQARDRQHSRLLAPVLPSRSTPTAELPVEPTQLGAARPRLSPSEDAASGGKPVSLLRWEWTLCPFLSQEDASRRETANLSSRRP